MRAVRGYDNYNCERSEMAIDNGSAATGKNIDNVVADKFDQLKMEIIALVLEARRQEYEKGLKVGVDTGFDACKAVNSEPFDLAQDKRS